MEQESRNSECVVCGAYIGSAGPREGRGPKSKRCNQCYEGGKVPDGYKLKYGSIVPK